MLFLFAFNARPAQAQEFLASGHYTGDGTSPRTITGVGFQPDVVIVKGDNTSESFIRTRTMPIGVSRPLGFTLPSTGGGIVLMGENSFTVGNSDCVNTPGIDYYWIAMREEAGVLDIGSYVGDGQTGLQVAVDGFQPDAALVMNESASHPAYLRTTDMPADQSTPLTWLGLTVNNILQFSDAFITVGNEPGVNTNGANFHFIAWKFTSDLITSGSFMGDTTDNVDIGVPFAPEYVLIKTDSSNDGAHRPSALLGDAALMCGGKEITADVIQALQPDGFQVGRGNEVNVNTKESFWIAFANATTSADMSVALAVDPDIAAEGDTLVFQAVLNNLGPEEAHGIQMVLALPAEVTFLTSVATSGSFSYPESVWDHGTLASGGTDTLWVSVQVDPGAAGNTLAGVATVSGTGLVDPDPLNNSASASVTVFGNNSDLSIQISQGQPVTAHPLGLAHTVLIFTVTNEGDAPDTLQSLTLTNLTVGEGTQEQLDSIWGTLEIAPDPVAIVKAQPVPVDFDTGKFTITGLNRVVEPGQTIEVTVNGSASAEAPDGIWMQLGIIAPDDLVFAGSVPTAGDWPLISGHVLVVDGFTVAQTNMVPVESKLLAIGSLRNLALVVDLPSNGYLSDTLNRLNVVNYGTASPGSDLARMEAWADDGDGNFDPIIDSLMGAFVNSGDRWELTGLTTVIPPAGRRIYFTVDVTETALPAGNAVLLGLPTLPDDGVGMLSGNDGPIDGSIDNPYAMGISVTDRIIMTSQWIHPGVVYPAASDLPVIHLAATNTFLDDRTLQGLTVTNTTLGDGQATTVQLDATCQQLVLRHDGDANGLLGDLATDPALGSGSFADGQVEFAGLDFNLPAGQAVHFFVTADLGLATVADGDLISAEISSMTDVDVTNSVIVADWPLDSGASWSVDGMIADQIVLDPISVLTLGPDDGPALALDLTVPANGYLADELSGLRLLNTGSADTDDLAGMALWEDGGDGVFDAGSGDDLSLGPMIFQDGTWNSPVMSRAIPLENLRLFVSLTVSDTPQDSSTVRLAVPIGGISTESGNSGPLDRQVTESGTLVLSTSPLLSSVAFMTDKVTVGLNGEVQMTIDNRGGETVLGIVPALAPGGGTATLVLGSPTPASFDLAPGESGVFSWSFSCSTPGEVFLEGAASGTGQISGLQRRSVISPTSTLRVFTPVPGIDLYPVTNLPFSINLGQTGVVPITLTMVNPGDEDVADGRLTALRLLLRETADGPDIAPSELLTRIVISEGTDTYVDLVSLPDIAEDFEIVLDRPVYITGDEPVTLGIRFDLRVDCSLPSFLLAINQADWFTVSDAVSEAAVTLSLGEGDFPILSGLGNLVIQATSLETAVVDLPASAAGPGQTEAILAEFDLSNLNADGSSSAIELGAVALAFRDSTGQRLADPDRVFSRISLNTSFQNHYSGEAVAGPDSLVLIQLTPPVLIPGNTTLTLRLTGDITVDPPLGPIWPETGDLALFDARDANTGVPVSIALSTGPAANQTLIMGPAESLLLSGEARLPSYVSQGSTNVVAMTATMNHPGTPGTAAIAVDTLTVGFFNHLHDPQDSARFLDSVQVMAGQTQLGMVPLPTATEGILPIPLSGLSLQPGQETELTFLFDFRPDAPNESLEMSLEGEGVDARDLVRDAQIEVTGAALPLYSGATMVVVAADELVVGGTSLMPAILAPQAEAFSVLRLNFANPASVESGALAVEEIIISQPQDLPGSVALGDVATEIRTTVDGQEWAAVSDLSPSATQITLSGAEPLLVPAGQDVDLVIEIFVQATLPTGVIALMVDEGGISATQADAIGTNIFVRASSGQTFPLMSGSGTLAAADLAGSYANFPNPFEAGRENTNFVYSLNQDATVTLRILTPHGEPVITLLDRMQRSAGLHQDDQWNGYNGNGSVVRNGVFIAELVVDFNDGTRQRVLRKVAVVR